MRLNCVNMPSAFKRSTLSNSKEQLVTLLEAAAAFLELEFSIKLDNYCKVKGKANDTSD